MKALLADRRLPLIAFLGLVLLSFAGCTPIRFIGPSPSPRWALLSCCASGAFLALGLLAPVFMRIRPTLREKAQEREAERQRRRSEAASHVR